MRLTEELVDVPEICDFDRKRKPYAGAEAAQVRQSPVKDFVTLEGDDAYAGARTAQEELYKDMIVNKA
ncbi:hypothetical protein BTVI_37912 [Pitangus sulphuratus]|nr:hypothetical protein BTVI_37912 [Pitangus sulphuratus]